MTATTELDTRVENLRAYIAELATARDDAGAALKRAEAAHLDRIGSGNPDDRAELQAARGAFTQAEQDLAAATTALAEAEAEIGRRAEQLAVLRSEQEAEAAFAEWQALLPVLVERANARVELIAAAAHDTAADVAQLAAARDRAHAALFATGIPVAEIEAHLERDLAPLMTAPALWRAWVSRRNAPPLQSAISSLLRALHDGHPDLRSGAQRNGWG